MIMKFAVRRMSTLIGLAALAAALLPAGSGTALADPPEVQTSLSSPTVVPGGSVTVTETVTNVHGFTILNPEVLLFTSPTALPSYTTLTGCGGATGPCTTVTDGGGHPIGYEAPTGSIGGFGSETVTFTLAIAADAVGGPQTIQGELSASNYGTPVVDGPVLTINTKADVAVDLTATPRLGLLVPSLDFAVKVSDQGPDILRSATVTTSLPPGLSGTSSSCAHSSGSVACTFGTVSNGGHATQHFSVPLSLLTLGIPFSFTATRTASNPVDPNPANDSATVQCTVVTPLLVSCN
jgi:Domain of unknown function DUF11